MRQEGTKTTKIARWEDRKRRNDISGAFSLTGFWPLISDLWVYAMIIPYENLNKEVLESLIEEFVSREGTDSGYVEGSLEESVFLIKDQLKKRQAFIVYDEKTETCNIVSAEFLKEQP